MNPFTHLVYTTKQLQDEHPYRVVWGIVGLDYPIFNLRGEYDKLDEYDGQAGREAIRDTGIISVEVKMRQDEKQGGQQEDDGWVMVQRMRGRDVVDDNEEGCTGPE
jgi:hypothetical protein